MTTNYKSAERKTADEAKAEIENLNAEFARIQRKRNKPKNFDELATRTYAHWNRKKPAPVADDAATDGGDDEEK